MKAGSVFGEVQACGDSSEGFDGQRARLAAAMFERLIATWDISQ